MREYAAKGMAEMSEKFRAEGGEIYKEAFKDAEHTPPATE